MAVVRGAPAAFSISVIFFGAFIFVALEWFHAERYETQEQRISFLTEKLEMGQASTSKLRDEVNRINEKIEEISNMPRIPLGVAVE